MRTLTLFLLVHIAAAGLLAQSEGSDPAALRKALKKDLEKGAPSVSGIDINGCILNVKLTRGGWVTVIDQPKELDVKPDYSVLRPQPSDTRPGEEAARHLTTGADEDFNTIETDKFSIDLSGSEFILGSGKNRDGLIPIAFAAGSKRDAISRKMDGKITLYSTLSFGLKPASVERVGNSIRQLATQCSQAK